MEKTIQQQYDLIKEGKGSKDDFLKNARRIFPEFITSGNDYNTTVHILKSKSILSEGTGKVVTEKQNWFKIFEDNIQEAVGVKDTKEYGDQNTFEKIDKDVQKALDHQFDNSNAKNIDNVYGQSFLMGYLAEMDDPKNAKKTVDELKAIVLKNMAKDINYYAKNGMFAVKGIGLETAKESKPLKGKYKSSGYGDLKEQKLRSVIRNIINEEMNEIRMFNDPIGYEKGSKSRMEVARDILKDAGLSQEEIDTFISDNMFKKGRIDDLAKAEVSKNKMNEGYGMSLEDAKAEAKFISDEEGVVQHVEETEEGSGMYRVSDFYNSDLTVASYENGFRM